MFWDIFFCSSQRSGHWKTLLAETVVLQKLLLLPNNWILGETLRTTPQHPIWSWWPQHVDFDDSSTPSRGSLAHHSAAFGEELSSAEDHPCDLRSKNARGLELMARRKFMGGKNAVRSSKILILSVKQYRRSDLVQMSFYCVELWQAGWNNHEQAKILVSWNPCSLRDSVIMVCYHLVKYFKRD